MWLRKSNHLSAVVAAAAEVVAATEEVAVVVVAEAQVASPEGTVHLLLLLPT